MDRENKRRELRYVATLKAVKDYDGDNTLFLHLILATEVRFTVNDTTNFTVGDRINEEKSWIKENQMQLLVVKRGFDRTLKVEHLNSKS